MVERYTKYNFFFSTKALKKAIIQCFKSLDSSPPLEKGGFLIGLKNKVKKEIIINDSCEAPFAKSATTNMEITHDDWESADMYLSKKYNDSKYNIYGWYHSHPGYGIFLSRKDIFIIRNFFNKPWNVSLIIDPLENAFGFFSWFKNKSLPILELELVNNMKNVNECKIIDICIIDKTWKYFEYPSINYNTKLDMNISLLIQIEGLFFENIKRQIFLRKKNTNSLEKIDIKLKPSEIGISSGDSIILERI